MSPAKLKMWVGNLDGQREGLVIAPTKKRAREIIGARTSESDFNSYWREWAVDLRLEPEVLYTRPFGAHTESWFRGRCAL